MHIVSYAVFIYYFNCISFAIRLSGRKVAIKLIDWQIDGGKDLWKRWVLSLEWNSECVMQGESGEQVGGELVSVTSLAGCFVQGRRNETESWFQRWSDA